MELASQGRMKVSAVSIGAGADGADIISYTTYSPWLSKRSNTTPVSNNENQQRGQTDGIKDMKARVSIVA